MPIPIEGQKYEIQPGDTLTKIASRAYGDATLWPRIWRVNQTTLRSGNPDIVFPGESVLIPFLVERIPPLTPAANRNPNLMSVILDGREIVPISGRIIRTIDTVANAYKVAFPWSHGDDLDLDARIRPYSYTPAVAMIGNDVIVTGVNYSVATSIGEGVTASIEGATPTADIVDSAMKPPLEFNRITLEDLITKLIEPLGFKAVFEVETPGEFHRVTANAGESIYQFLSKLTKQRDAILSCDVDGNIVVTRAIESGVPVAMLEENATPGVKGWGAVFDGRRRFNVYRAVGKSPKGAKEATVIDPAIPRSRFTTINTDESTIGDIQASAQWARNKTLADTLTFNLTLEGWRDPSGELWRENTIVTVISNSMFLPDGFDFLINRVEYVLGDSGRSTILSLVPPTVYRKGEIEEPW